MGWVYNLTVPDPHSHVSRVIAICLVFSITACLAVFLRLYIRIHTKRSAWLDDFAALWSALLAMTYAGIAVAQTRWGLGLDAKYFPDQNVVMFSKIQYAGGPVYTLALLGFKVSLLSSYLRIGGFVQAYRVTIIVAIVAVTCNQLVFTFLLLFACNPVARQWDTSLPGSCIDTVASYYALAGTSLGFDIIIIALPLPVLLTLQLRLRQKIALVGVFALGFFITIIQIIRIFTIKNLKTYTDSQPIVIWSDVEISLGVIITCIPTYGPFFHAFASTLSSSYNNNRTHTTNNTYNNPHNTYATLTYLTSPTTTTSTSYPLRKTQTRNTTASSIVTNNGGRKKSRDLVDASLDEVARGLGMGGLELGLESGMLFGTSGSEEGRSVRSRSRSRSSCGGGRGRSCSPSGGYGGVWDGSGVAPTTTTICSLPAVARVREGGFGNGGCVDEDMMEAGVGGGFGVSAVGGGSSSSMVTGSAGVSGNGNGNGNGNGWRIQKIMEVRVERE
ncbi:hypothetical protein AtubIFM54640_009541 [Aspergillus tubingensis]|uniref:putative integral membrane protein (Pth11) n=1 Tax=Aspergillus tubingensis TaxID=5068 RepID=UPI0015794609|nr:uncharacterized protein AtWU_02076 [Aspergillus tubingensis]GFN12279.1 integral membrane protein [Aspergillus tubingensis]GLA66950.1 hypothetical protein AtubIFM54640_009541 [Aspergillus tubingensis]GLB20009.1 hypothetical protein AtubIFM61612_009935 [Aspergillus tubingensis]